MLDDCSFTPVHCIETMHLEKSVFQLPYGAAWLKPLNPKNTGHWPERVERTLCFTLVSTTRGLLVACICLNCARHNRTEDGKIMLANNILLLVCIWKDSLIRVFWAGTWASRRQKYPRYGSCTRP